MLELPQDPRIDVNAELGAKNASLLRTFIFIFNPIYVSWVIFDVLLAPQQVPYFLTLRITAATLNLCFLFERDPASRVARSNLYFWLWFFISGAFIAPMLPRVGDNFLPYLMGLCIVLLGVGVIPYWKPRWAMTSMMAICGVALLALVMNDTQLSSRDVIVSLFLVPTVIVVSAAGASFRYRVTVNELGSREALQAQQRALEEKHQALEEKSHALEEERQTTERLREAERQRGAELAAALERLEKLDRFKTDFFASVSHELRTPLTLVLSPIEQLLSTADQAAREELLRIRRNASRLLLLIDELLDLSRLDAGGLRLNIAEVDICALVAIIHENVKALANARSIGFTLEIESRPEGIFGDAHRIESILTNLVSNALKYTPDGGLISLKVSGYEEGARVLVADTGIGIPAEDLPYVFERFYQVARPDRRRVGGVGIGLALAKELTELHGGKLDVSSAPGKGTTFELDLRKGREHFRPEVIERRKSFMGPVEGTRRSEDLGLSSPNSFRPVEVPPPPRVELTGWEGIEELSARARVLVVEDQPEMRDFIVQLFEPHCDVSSASDGRAGIAMARELRPDLIISDVMMPGTTGTKLCHEIKCDPELRHTPVILLTARVGSEATLEAYAHGADDFVPKPFHPRVLVARARAQLRIRMLAVQLATKEKEEMVQTLSEGMLGEVRAPMNIIANGVRLLAETGSGDPAASRLVELMRDAADDVDRLLSVLDRHERTSLGSAPHFCEVRSSIDTALGFVAHRTRGLAMHVESGGELLATVSARALQQVMFYVLDAALRAGAKNIWVDVREEPTWVSITVADDGVTATDMQLSRMFDPFAPPRGTPATEGLGLHFSRRLVDAAGGKLTARHRPGGGVEVALRLPLAFDADRVAQEVAPRVSTLRPKPLHAVDDEPSIVIEMLDESVG